MKKLSLITVVVTVIMFTACKKQSFVNPNQNTETKKSTSARDGHYDLLGYGYDVTGDYAVSASAKAKVFDVASLKAAYSTRVDSDFSHTSIPQLYAGASAYEYSQKMSNKTTATTGFAVFKGSLTAAFTDTSLFSSKFIYSQYNLYIQRKRWFVNAPVSILKSFLDPAFVTDLANQTPAYIVAHYGTHVLTNIMLGGRLSIFYQGQTKNTSRYSAADIGLKFSANLAVASINVGDSISTSSLETSKNYNQTLSIITHGGDPATAIATSVPVDGYSSPAIDVTSWQSTVTDANSELVDIDPTGLIKLSDLVDDPTKAAALSSYIDSYLVANSAHNTPTELYQYYNVSKNKHAFSVPSNQNFNGYVLDGPVFKVYTTPYAGAVPVYQFLNPSTLDHVLTTNRFPGWSGYNYDGIVFYAYATHVSGTIPIYEWWSTHYTDHCYTTSSTTPSSWFTYNSTPFYAFPL